jgi:hypothetical protein
MIARERRGKRRIATNGSRAGDRNRGGGAELAGVGYAGGVSRRR